MTLHPAIAQLFAAAPEASRRLLERVFDPEDTTPVADERRVEAFLALLELFPDAPISPFLESGSPAPALPESVPSGSHPVLIHNGMDGLSDEDRLSVISTWDRVGAVGAGGCVVHPFGFGAVCSLMLDLTTAYGVRITTLVAADGEAAGTPTAVIESSRRLPRLATVRKDDQAVMIGVDAALCQILGWEPHELEGRRSLDFVHPDDRTLAVENWVRMRTNRGPVPRVRLRMLRKDDCWVWFEVTNHDLLEDPSHRCVFAEMVDISEEMAVHESLREREQLLNRLAETVPVGLAQVDRDGRIVYANERFAEILGAAGAGSLLGTLSPLLEVDRVRLEQGIRRVLADGTPSDFEVALRLPSDEALRFCTINLRALTRDDGSPSGAIACVADITETARMRDALRVKATFDDLTGCYNRGSIMQALHSHIARSPRHVDRAVVFVDLDNFKGVNDRLGHAAGDDLLRAVGETLRDASRSQDLVGRIGGDEFLLVCPEIGDADRALRLAERLTDRLAETVQAASDGLARQVSAGVAWARGDDVDADALVDRADRAMYESKRERRGRARLATDGPVLRTVSTPSPARSRGAVA